MLTSDILQEIAAQNMGRNYPLDPSVSVLPFPVLVAADINIPYSMLSVNRVLRYTIYLRRVVITSNDIEATIAARLNENNQSTDVAIAHASYDTLRLSREVALAPITTNEIPELNGVSGFLYFGDVDLFMGYANVWNLNVESGAFALDCIHPYPDSFTGFIVNGNRFTGDIILEAGEGVEINVTDDNHIVFTSSTDIDSSLIKNRDELINAIVTKFGNPILTINNISSDPVNHNFTITSDPGGCCTISQVDNGLVFNNPCATTCCDKSYLDTVISNINELNSRASRLTDYLTSVSTNLNSLNNELAMLKLSVNQK